NSIHHCRLCGIKVKERNIFQRHLLIHGKDESNWCRICSKPFSRSSIADIFIKEHILITHLKYKPYKCQHCDFSAFSQKSFSVHSRTGHVGTFTFMEERNIGSLNASKAVLNVVKPTKPLPPFKCVFCDLEEIKEEFMRYHLYIHLDYKPFKCDQCTQAFSDPFQQKQHINGDHTLKAKVLDSSSSSDISTASKNTNCMSSSLQYRCLRCNTICYSEYDYRQHLATHKTFKCLVPDLARNPQLKCEICSYRSQDTVKFTKHMI
ncbi:hypothetical protein LOTGIDRAFT_83597, partial [Lottia gigantea]